MATPTVQYPTSVIDNNWIFPSNYFSCSNRKCRHHGNNYSCACDGYGNQGYGKKEGSQNNNKGCYGYDTSSVELYECPGHRDPDNSRNICQAFTNNLTSDAIISALSLNTLNTAINTEINRRKQHRMYSTMTTNNNTVNANTDPIEQSKPNNIEKVVERLRSKIQSYDDKQSNNTTSAIYDYSIKSASLAKPKPLIDIYNEINYKYKDCICHADCSSYGLIFSTTCTCNSNCGCDYK